MLHLGSDASTGFWTAQCGHWFHDQRVNSIEVVLLQGTPGARADLRSMLVVELLPLLREPAALHELFVEQCQLAQADATAGMGDNWVAHIEASRARAQEELAELALHEWIRETGDELKRRSPVIEELCARGLLHLECLHLDRATNRLARV